MSESNVLKLDINSLTRFQKELHEPDENKDLRDPKNQVNSRFSCNVEKNAWATHTKVKLTHNAEEGQVVYTASKKFDVIFGAELIINLPPIKVKDRYKKRIQICYPHNPGHNIGHNAELKIDDDHQEGFDSIWLDNVSQFYMKSGAGKRDLYNRMVGNIPCLEEWGTDLPGLKLMVPQPYSFGRNTRVGLRTLRSSMNTVTFQYKIRNKIHEILRMRVLKEDDIWVEIPCKVQYLDIPENAKDLPIPELWARQALMTDEERDWHKFEDPATKTTPKTHVIYTEDVFIATSNNPTAIGSTDIIKLQCKSPCKALFWNAQDIKNIPTRNFSNYTTNRDNLLLGWNPCSNVDLKYGSGSRIDDMSHEHFDMSEPWDMFPSAPSEPGYNGYSLGFEQGTLNADTAIVLDSLTATLHIKLGDTDPFRTIEEPDEEIADDGDLIPVEALVENQTSSVEKNKYIIHVRALVYKKLIVSWNEKDKAQKYLLLDDATRKDLPKL